MAELGTQSQSELPKQQLTVLPAATEGLSEEDTNVLRAFSFKMHENVSRGTYKRMNTRYFPGLDLGSQESNRARMTFLSGFKPVRYDCCLKICVLFVGKYADLRQCPVCSQDRYIGSDDKKPAKQFTYLPVTPRLQALYRNTGTASRQLYQDEATRTHEPGKLRDYVDGTHYRSLLGRPVVLDGKRLAFKYFGDARDVVLGVSTDGFAPFKKRKHTC
ncbi:hypothetical protein AURDEDRAFT_76999, partial [Auricularia subglabra TFB-10046 SS5]